MIEAAQLTKSFGQREALKGIGFTIQAGEFHGILGPNGAGKTTTISILSSILKADAGDVKINGLSLKDRAKEVKRLIGVVPQEIALYNELSAMENLMFWGSMYDVPRKKLVARANELLSLVGLADRKHDKVKGYSGGMKRRINIASSLLHAPKVLFMDEPTVGIDPQSRNLIFEVVEQLHAEGMTIVYTTHYMEEAERLCDRISIIDDGRIIAEGTLDELRRSSSVKEAVTISFSAPAEDRLMALSSFWTDRDQVGSCIRFFSPDVRADLPKLVLQCNQHGMEIASIEVLKADLEAIFLNLTGKQLRD